MEVLVRKERIWWKEAARMMVVTSSEQSWSTRMVK
jgi:hypothetical protein